MAYLGNVPAEAYSSIDKQVITGDGGTSYTLDHSVANENEIEVFVNNVRQEPSVAYTVSGTALTMTGNVESSDDFYVVFQGKAIQTVVPPDLTVDTAKIKDSAVTTAKIADDAVTTDKVNFYETGTWTPTLRGSGTAGSVTHVVQTGLYTKIGNIVVAKARLQWNAFSGSSGSLQVRGLPYNTKTQTNSDHDITTDIIMHNVNMPNDLAGHFAFYTSSTTDYLTMLYTRDNLAWAGFPSINAHTTSDNYMNFTVTYMTND